MAVPPTSAAAFCLAAFLAAGGCAGAPKLARAVTVREGSTTTAQLMNFGAGETQVLTLQNLSSVATDEPGSAPRLAAKTKVVPDAVLQELLDYYAELGLFAGAGNRVPTEARSAIVVTADGQRYALHGTTAVQERRDAYSQAFSLFFQVFNSAAGYHQAGVRDSFRDGDGNRPIGGGKSR